MFFTDSWFHWYTNLWTTNLCIYDPEEILQLPEVIGLAQDMHIVVCIDEFQQIGEMTDSLTIQKRLRGIWQHQRHVSYCLFGSKKHMMTRLFSSLRRAVEGTDRFSDEFPARFV